MTLKDQLEQEIRKRQLHLSHTSQNMDDLSELRSRLGTTLTTFASTGLPHNRDVEALLLDHQAKKIVDDLVEPQLIGRVMSPVGLAFTRSRSPFRGHMALPHSPVPF